MCISSKGTLSYNFASIVILFFNHSANIANTYHSEWCPLVSKFKLCFQISVVLCSYNNHNCSVLSTEGVYYKRRSRLAIVSFPDL